MILLLRKETNWMEWFDSIMVKNNSTPASPI